MYNRKKQSELIGNRNSIKKAGENLKKTSIRVMALSAAASLALMNAGGVMAFAAAPEYSYTAAASADDGEEKDYVAIYQQIMAEYGYIPEIMDCKENETAIEYDFIYSEEKTLWEEAYKAYKEKYPTAATKRVKVLQGFYDGEWSDICEYDMDETKELKSDWEAYNKNESCPHRIIVRRVKLEKTNK